MIKKLYCGGPFDFDCRDENYLISAEKDYRVVSILKDLDLFLYARKEVDLTETLEYIGPFYYETEEMKGEDIVAKELKMIEKCTDAVFVFDRANCPGTVAECIYAATLKKRIHLFFTDEGEKKETESELHTPCWFSILSAQSINPENTFLYQFKSKDELYKKISQLFL